MHCGRHWINLCEDVEMHIHVHRNSLINSIFHGNCMYLCTLKNVVMSTKFVGAFNIKQISNKFHLYEILIFHIS